MQYIFVLLVVAAVFGLCFLIDKGFTALFRSKNQHRSGHAVRQMKRYGSFGIVIAVFGIACIFAAASNSWLFYIIGALLLTMGISMVVYYMSFGIYYDEESFLVERFGKRSAIYQYRDIRAQQLYAVGATVMVELYLSDGKTLQLQSKMDGFTAFLDKAYEQWLKQTGTDPQTCTFHDREQFCWFPAASEE